MEHFKKFNCKLIVIHISQFYLSFVTHQMVFFSVKWLLSCAAFYWALETHATTHKSTPFLAPSMKIVLAQPLRYSSLFSLCQLLHVSFIPVFLNCIGTQVSWQCLPPLVPSPSASWNGRHIVASWLSQTQLLLTNKSVSVFCIITFTVILSIKQKFL